MKPDGVTMDTTDATEPNETAGAAEPTMSQGNITEQTSLQPEKASNDAAPEVAKKANGKSDSSEPKVKQAVALKMQATTKTDSKSKSGASSNRLVNDVHSNNKMTTAKKSAALPPVKPSIAGAVPKKVVGVATVPPTVKNQTKVPDKRPVGSVRTTVTAATATNGAKNPTVNGTHNRRTAAETGGVARPKTAGASSRSAASVAPKSSTSATAKTDAARVPKATRPTAAPSRPQTSSSTSRTVTTRPSTATTARSATSKVTTAPSSARTTAAQTSRATTTTTTTAAAKKDVGRPPSAAGAKRPTTVSAPTATKKTDPLKPTAAGKPNSASKFPVTAKAADPKVSQTKTQQLVKPSPTKKPGVVATVPHAANKQPFGRTPPASPANKPSNSGTSLAKRGTKPTQAVPPFTAAKKTKASNSVTSAETPRAVEEVGTAAAAAAAVAVVVSATVVAAATVQTEMDQEAGVILPQESVVAASAPEEAHDTSPELMPQEPAQSHLAASSPSQTPVRTPSPEISTQEQGQTTEASQEQGQTTEASQKMAAKVVVEVEPILPRVAPPQEVPEEHVNLLTDQTPSTSKVPQVAENPITQVIPSTNLNEDEDEEEKEGSQQVSVSEMSGTTQPTEESRPGSAGLVGGSAWRAGGALFSELDSEDVSGSQQGASELSAPGVLEGTESTDDLGDGSLKGAIDIEGASAGSPDFEKLPDIPVNDFEEDDDDEDDNDRVCDMDVGSERADEPPRPRHDNDLDDEEDDDVEMASEGVTESGLESYGNADEDDFAEDERVDNLNRVAQPPPPPQLPSAPAAQWDQPNPFADPWAEPPQPQQLFEQVPQPLQQVEAAAASPLIDPWQADSETPTQSSAQAWLELSSAPFGAEDSPKDRPQMYMDQCMPAPMQTLAPAPSSAPGMSLSSTLSSDSSTPEELGDFNREGKPQPQDPQKVVPSPQASLDNRDLGIQLERGNRGAAEDEAESLPADEVSGGPATAPASNPSSSSVTEDEASDTEGEAQLDDSLESPTISSITFDSQPPAQRCLSTVEEGEEAETEVDPAATDDTTPPSATSLASYGFDSTTTASTSNAQSTGESCIKSPGIFSLEELSEEAKDACLIPHQPAQTCLAEQQYIECGKRDSESAEEEAPGSREAPDHSAAPGALQQSEENPDDIQPPYYSAICEKTENSFAGLAALPHPHRREHSAHARAYCDVIKPHGASVTPPRLTCADLPPRSAGQQALSPQLRRLEQHHRQLLELQQRREQQSRPLEEAEQERKRREEEEQRRKKEEAEEEIKRNKEEEERRAREKKEEEEEKQRRELELQLQQQQEELKQRQQIMQWQQELQQSNKGQAVLLSPSSGLCTIYEALENSDNEEDEDDELKELKPSEEKGTEEKQVLDENRLKSDSDKLQDSPLPSEDLPDCPRTPSPLSHNGDSSSPCLPESPERPPPLDLDWGKKVDIVQQLINQTLLLNGDGCSSLLLLPGGAGGTLSPLESSLWPSLLPPLTPPSATVTSVSSFSPEATGSSPQGEWTVVELETHH